VATEIGYRDTNVWMEWIKYSVRTLNKSDCYVCTTGRPESQVVLFSLGWSSDPDGMYLHVGSVSGCEGLRQQILLNAITTVSRGQRSCGSAPRTIRPPALDVNYTVFHQIGGGGDDNWQIMGNLMGCSESW
jgi:hypothetical protein